MSYLSGLIRAEQVQLELRATEKAGVLRELIALLPELQGEFGQREAFLQALLERERLHTTAIGEGIALPHARNPLGGLLKRSILIFGRHPQGIAYGALDNQPVQLFFMLASPNLTDHLAMLARLSRVLRDTALRNALLTLKRSEDVARLLEEAELRTIR